MPYPVWALAPTNPGGELGVEDVGDLGPPGAAQDRHVLAAGVEHDLDRWVGEQLRDRGHVDARSERVDQVDTRLALGARVIVDGDLHQTQQRAVAAFGHEFGVDAEAVPRELAPPPRRGAARAEVTSGGRVRSRRATEPAGLDPRNGPMDAELAESGSVRCERRFP